MANPISRRKEEIKLVSDINALKKKGGDLTDKEIKSLQAKEKQLGKIKKELALINKVREEGERKIYSLTSQVEILQKSIGKVIKGTGKDTIKWSNAAHQTGIATLGIKNNTLSIQNILGKLPRMMNQFADGAESVVEYMKDAEKNAAGMLDDMRKAGNIAGTMVDFRTKEGQATRKVVSGWLELKQIVGQTVAEMVTGLGNTIESSKALLINLDEIGTGTFMDMVGEMEKQERAAERNLELWEQRKKEMELGVMNLRLTMTLMGDVNKMTRAELDLYRELEGKLKDTTEQIDKGNKATTTAIANARANVELAKQQKVQNQQITAAVEAVVGPFGKLKTAMEALPFGSLISSALGMDGIMSDFQDTATEAFKKVQAGTMSEAVALDVVMVSADKMISTLVSGLKFVARTMLANPILILVAGLVAATMAMKKLYAGTLELRKEMGLSFAAAADLQKTINMTTTQFSFLGVEASDVESIVAGIQDSMGGVGEATHELVISMARLNADFGIAGGSAATLVTQMKAVGAASDQAAISQLESVGYLAQASGVAPAAIMDSVSESSEAFAGFAKDGGKNMFKAAIAAKKLGVEFSSIMTAAEGLLEFESSIEASMEASMLLGRNINSDLAREMAFRGDIEGMQGEILKQVGSQADFEKMNVLQRQALAKAFGLSVSELGSMISNQEKLNNMTSGEKRTRDQINKLLESAGKVWAQILSLATKLFPVVIGIAGAIAIAFAPLTAWGVLISAVLYGVSKLVDEFEGLEWVIGAVVGLMALWKLRAMQIGIFGQKKVKDLVKEFAIEKGITREKQKQVAAEVAESGAGASGGAASAVATGAAKGGGLLGLAAGLSAMGTGPVALGALNLGLFGVMAVPALLAIPFLAFIAAFGAPVAAGLTLLGGGLLALGNVAASGVAFLGPLLIAALGAAMIPFAFALKLAVPFVKAIAEGFVLLAQAGAGLITAAVGVGALGLALAGWGSGALLIGVGVGLVVAFGAGLLIASKFAVKLSSSMEDINKEMEETIKNKDEYQSFLDGFQETLNPLKKLGKKLGEALWSGFGMAGLLGESPSRLGERIRDGITAIMGGLLDSFGRLFDGIGQIFSSLLGFFGGLWNGIKGLAMAAWDGILAGARWLGDGIKTVWGGIKAGAQVAWDGIKGGAQWTWDKVKSGLTGLKETLTPAWEGIKSGALTAWEGIKEGWDAGSFAPVWDGLKEGASQAWEGMKGTASIAAEKVKATWSSTKEVVGQGWDKAKDLASQAWEGTKQAASTAWSGIKSIFGFASGGIVPKPGQKPKFFANGTDSVPAMLTPGEMILNEEQQATAFGGGGSGTASLEAKVDRLVAAIESGNSQLSTIAGNTGQFADSVVR